MISKSKTAVLIVAVGEMHQRIHEITRPTVLTYADRIGSDLIVISDNFNNENPKSLKFTICDYLKSYDRLIYLDGDIAINPDCPDLFELVPSDCLGATCEALPYFNRNQMVKDLCAVYHIKYPGNNNYRFINSGMMVISKIHMSLFEKPDKIIPIHGFFDQPYINAKLMRSGTIIHDLGLKFNHTGTFLLRGARPFGHGNAFMVHATGALHRYRLEYLKFVTGLWSKSNR